MDASCPTRRMWARPSDESPQGRNQPPERGRIELNRTGFFLGVPPQGGTVDDVARCQAHQPERAKHVRFKHAHFRIDLCGVRQHLAAGIHLYREEGNNWATGGQHLRRSPRAAGLETPKTSSTRSRPATPCTWATFRSLALLLPHWTGERQGRPLIQPPDREADVTEPGASPKPGKQWYRRTLAAHQAERPGPGNPDAAAHSRVVVGFKEPQGFCSQEGNSWATEWATPVSEPLSAAQRRIAPDYRIR
jgi:hypothetical protein